MKKKHIVTLTSLITGLALLSTSAFINASGGSGYSLGKDAVKKIVLSEKNYTVEYEGKMTYNGQIVNSTKFLRKDDGKSSSQKTENLDNDNPISYSENYNTPEEDISAFYMENEVPKYFVNKKDPNSQNYPSRNMFNISPNDESTQQQIRFVELLGDTLVGDLKNVFVSEDLGDKKQITISLTTPQIPELYNAGLSAVAGLTSANFNDSDYKLDEATGIGTYTEKKIEGDEVVVNVYEQNDSKYEERKLVSTTREPLSSLNDYKFPIVKGNAYVNSVDGTLNVDEEGRPLEFNGTIAVMCEDLRGFDGVLEIQLSGAFSDYGITTPDTVVLTDENTQAPPVEKYRYEDLRTALGTEPNVVAQLWNDGMRDEALSIIRKSTDQALVLEFMKEQLTPEQYSELCTVLEVAQ